MTRDPPARTRRQLLHRSLALAGISLLGGCGFPRPFSQAPPTARRIGYLDAGINDPATEAAFRDGMHDLGYDDGRKLQIEVRSAEGHLERLPALAAELVDLPVEIIVVGNNSSLIAASQATTTIPIVTLGGSVVNVGLVTNIAHPEGNITGVAAGGSWLKWLELLTQTVPSISHLAVVADVTLTPPLKGLEAAAQTLQLPLSPYDVHDFDQLSAAVSRAVDDGADALVFVSGGVIGGAAEPRIRAEVLRSRLPAIAELRAFAVNGGLLAHGPNSPALARRSATHVGKILNGARPGDLPIELPAVFEIVVNLRAATALGITVPNVVLQQATEIIQSLGFRAGAC